MLISRQVGTVSSLITVFLANRTVSTGAGLANIVASTVRLTWLRDDMAAVSSWTLTTGTLGTWTGSTMTQVGSTSTLGAYQFSLPNGLFASGNYAYAHIMSSTATFAEVPLVFELTKTDNQTYLSSQVIGRVNSPVGVSTLPAVTSMTVGVNVTSIHGSAAVTSAAGVYGPLAVSSISTPVTASTAGVTSISIPVGVSQGTVRVSAATIPFGVSSLTAAALGNFFDTGAFFFSTAVVSSVVYEIAKNATVVAASTPVTASSVTAAVNISSIYGSAAVTSAAGVLQPGAVTSLTVGALSSFFTADAGDYSTSVLGSVVQEIADNVSATVGAQVGVSSISIPVSVSSGTVAVSSISIPVGVSTITTPVSVSSVTAVVSSNIVQGNNVTVTGTGAAGDEWGP